MDIDIDIYVTGVIPTQLLCQTFVQFQEQNKSLSFFD